MNTANQSARRLPETESIAEPTVAEAIPQTAPLPKDVPDAAAQQARANNKAEMLQTIAALEKRVEELAALTEQILRDNEVLHNDRRLLQQEYKTLQEKNKIAYGRVEQIVSRLKSLEH